MGLKEIVLDGVKYLKADEIKNKTVLIFCLLSGIVFMMLFMYPRGV